MENPKEELVNDSSFDHNGRPPLRATTGVWRASLYIIAIEFSERLSYFGLATNLIIYLTTVLHMELKTAAKTANNWIGVTTVMPLVGGFVADAYLGRFSTVLVSSSVYVVGLILLTMSQLVSILKPCTSYSCHKSSKLHEAIFFVAIYLISVASGGHKPSLESFGADQFDDNHTGERIKKMSFFNWWNFGLCCGLLIGVTVIAYVQESVSWAVGYIILAVVMCVSLVIFFVGRPFYRYRAALGSPFTPMVQVLVASVAKRKLALPSDATELFEEEARLEKKNERFLCHTSRFRFLDKAAIVEHKHNEAEFTKEKSNHWRLATVNQVEELKLILSMIPIWLVSLPFGMGTTQASTLFIKQASSMDRKLPTSSSFEIPAASIYSLSAVGMIVSVSVYDRLIVPFARRATGNERGISILQRIGVGFVLTASAMGIAAVVETRRLKLAESGRLMSVLWLVPQFMVVGVSDGFSLVGLQEYFYEQVPDGMRSLGIALYLSVIGAGSFLNSLLISVVDGLSERGGSEGWFARELNGSRVDRFFWLLGGIIFLSVFVFVYVASRYSYKNVHGYGNVGDGESYREKYREDGLVGV